MRFGKMKNVTKIILFLILSALLIGSVAAFDVDTLKSPTDYNKLKDGSAAYTTNSNRMLYVEKASGDYVADWFTNSSDMTVCDMGNNTYYYESDGLQMYGYQELVDLDGEKYIVSINQDSKLSPGEQTQYLKDLQEFNKLNNLEPIAV